ncbi:MAG TPA: hypothetical protein VGQ57_00095 [Polyangiaceae bacterium]|jgi:hypothetical protein|nr:hypothetical protein [Polyangiaceae bacterium]
MKLGSLLAVYGVALSAGALFGLSRGVALFDAATKSTSTPLVRVGLALRDASLVLTPQERESLRADLDTVRTTWPGEPQALDLVAALRGLTTGDGSADWARAEALCHELKWPRCDRPALELLQKRSVP